MNSFPAILSIAGARSDSVRQGRLKYTMTGRDHDLVPDRHLRPGDLAEPRLEGLAMVGSQSDYNPVPPTEDILDLCSPLFPNQHGRGRLGTTDQGRSLGVGLGSRQSR